MNTSWRIAALLAVLLSPGAARADMGFPGLKDIGLLIVLDNLDDYPDYRFYFVPAHALDPKLKRWEYFYPGPRELRVRWSMPTAYVLVAVPRQQVGADGRMSSDAMVEGTPGVLHSNRVEKVARTDASPPIIWPFDYEKRRYRVDLTDGRLSLTLVSVGQGSDSILSWIPAILTALAITGIGVWVVRRRRRRRTTVPSP